VRGLRRQSGTLIRHQKERESLKTAGMWPRKSAPSQKCVTSTCPVINFNLYYFCFYCFLKNSSQQVSFHLAHTTLFLTLLLTSQLTCRRLLPRKLMALQRAAESRPGERTRVHRAGAPE